ncbi:MULTISPECIES: outer membrane beta-barrel protein [unclassified Fibrobacter]|uniref:outer membrane beta-barrel protein n=1 Tax=unclassified Fibrobacter TaxID=2634177 RepID=UPI000D6B520E|nr:MULTISPECIES: outer membrane beta-barrel protein [unclassified Fibrobacter]PWJ64906.1 outer membrane protein with beta-barrel domain [Fibrobacter sp. UWR4]PZW68971.1 outer membrane protein with beta-barrel domain [Fibrobacter sp. UWR1]
MMNRKTSCTALSVLTLSLLGATDRTFAQGVFEGSGEEETSSNCVGDGCGIDFPAPQDETQVTETSDGSETVSEEAQADDQKIASDSTQQAQDSAAVAHLDDEEDAREYFVESSSEYKARKEGFSRRIQFGVRVGGGINLPFGDNDGWNLGFGFGGGIAARLPLTSGGLGVAAGLEFGYRQFHYEGKTEFSKDEATVSQMLFEIPVTLQYAFDDEGFFFGVGGDIQLKMQGESDFTQKIDTDQVHAKDKRHNTLPTTGVEAGATAILGFAFTSWCQMDVRGTFNFTNLLDQDVIAESSLMDTALHMLHLNAGFTILL